MYALAKRPFKQVKRELLEDFEKRYLLQLLEQHRFNLSAVERSSGLSRRHMVALIHKYGLYEQVLRARINSLVKLLP